MSAFRFMYPWVLWFEVLVVVLLIPPVFRFFLKRRAPVAIKFPIPIPFMPHIRPDVVNLLCEICALALLFIALARPQIGSREVNRTVSGIDIMMLLDVSISMNIEDLIEGVSRLDTAKKTMEQFILGRQHDRIGFVIFSGAPLTLAPPTLDYALLFNAMKQAVTGVLADGTAIGDGLALGLVHLRQSQAKSKVVILLTDGDNNLGQIDPATAGAMAESLGVRVYTIAIGKEGRVRIPIRQRGLLGNIVTTYQEIENSLNPELLQKIAEISHGKFYRVTDAKALSRVFAEINALEKNDATVHERVLYEEHFFLPLFFGIIVLSFGQVFLHRRVLP